MRVLQVIHTFPPFSTAGSELYALSLSRELSGRAEVSVFYRFNDPSKAEYIIENDKINDIPVRRINNNFRGCDSFEKTYLNNAVAGAFSSYLDEIKPDIVHFHHVTCLSLDLVEIAKSRGCGVVFTLHDFWLICQRGQLLDDELAICRRPVVKKCASCFDSQITLKYSKIEAFFGLLPQWLREVFRPLRYGIRKIEKRNRIRVRTKQVRKLFRNVDMFIAPSNFLLKKFRKAGVRKKKIIYCDYGFDTSLFEEKEASGNYSDKMVFGYIGTLIPSKGVHVLIRAFSELEHENCELWIYGAFSDYHGFEDYATNLTDLAQGNERIKFMGKYDNSAISDVLAGIDVVVVPSLWYENSPLTIHEAYLSGTPVIASDQGGMAELVIDGISGYHFEIGNYVSLKEKMEYLLKNPDEMGKLKKGIPEVKSITKNVEEIMSIYEGLVKSE